MRTSGLLFLGRSVPISRLVLFGIGNFKPVCIFLNLCKDSEPSAKGHVEGNILVLPL